MRCPKCQYITFDSDDRCRNCGYEFSLSVESVEDEPVEVRIARDEPESMRRGSDSFSALDTPLNQFPADTNRPGAQNGRRPLTADDLPLFIEQRVADDQAPLVTPPAVPRAPLSVRRAAPVRPRSRGPVLDELPLGPPEDSASGDSAEDTAGADSAEGIQGASIARRVAAGIIDVGILGTIGAVVVLLTLRIAELPLAEWRILPVAPMLAFLLLLCGGYFILFTAAGGQTIGKMTAGIRVVNAAEDGPARVSFGTAFIRTVTCLGSVLALGGGFLPVLFSADRRAFHDRVADTRVVAA
jgi:uncharacterized RDD family membrane protein YckC